MTNAIRIHGHGGADALRREQVEVGDPDRGERALEARTTVGSTVLLP
jgi:hypothetical protein